MESNDPPERKEDILKEVEASLSRYPQEYESMFQEFKRMSEYIIRSNVCFVKQDRVEAYSPNKFSKELLKDQAQDVNIYPPPLVDD